MASKNVYMTLTVYIFILSMWAILAVLTITPEASIIPSEPVVLDLSVLLIGIVPIIIIVAAVSYYNNRRKTKTR